jgi:hypothetical protein
MEEEHGSCNVPINSIRLTNQICITWLPTVYGTNVAPLASVKTIIALDVRIDLYFGYLLIVIDIFMFVIF